MKIIFICGSLEPGKDGVGDYTRRLCSVLLKQGVSVGMLAYNDKYISNKLEDCQWSEGYDIPCIRLPHTWRSKARCKEAKNWVDLYDPEWLSLQFVIYSFNNKGLPFSLSNQLKKIGSNKKWHIMFHELWLGMNKLESIKNKAIGYIQKGIIKSLLKKLEVDVTTTQSQLYLNELKKIILTTGYLPLHGNIPLAKVSNSSKIKNNVITFVIFGSVRKETPIAEFSKEFASYFNSIKSVQGSLILAGRSGEEQLRWAREFEKHKIDVKLLGEMNVEEISKIFQNSDYGIATTPIQLIEKSGAVAAMREHNLPIIVVSKKWNSDNQFPIHLPDSYMEYKTGNFSELMNKKINLKEFKNIDDIATDFLNYLTLEV